MTVRNVYVGCFTDDIWNYYPRPEVDRAKTSPGLERLVFDDATGDLQYCGSTGGGLRSPQYLACHPNLPALYAAEFSGSARMLAYDIQPDGSLLPRPSVDSLGAMALAVEVHPNGQVAYVCHLGGGVLSTVRIDTDGTPAPARLVAGTSPEEVVPLNPEAVFDYKGAGSKLHHLQVAPDGSCLVVADVGCDEVSTYSLGELGDPAPLPMARLWLPHGSSPRHVEFHPSGRRVYVVTEGDSRLYVLEADGFVPMRILSVHALVPAGYDGGSLPSEVRLHPNGRTLFVGVRRADHIAIFDVNDDGDLSLDRFQASGGRDPRGLAVAPGGRYLLVANWQSSEMSVFAIDPDRGLVPVGSPVTVPSPSSIAFGPPLQ